MYAELKQIVCERCKETKQIRFYRTQKLCVDCARIDRAERKAVRRSGWRQANPEKYSVQDNKYDLMKHYGITPKQRQEMFNRQNGCCAICGKHESEFQKRLHVDHVHDETKLIRGLLCTRCNPGLGYFEDAIELLKAAIIYLEKFKK